MCQDIIENFKEADCNPTHVTKTNQNGGLFAQLDTSAAEQEMRQEAKETKAQA